MDAQTDLQQTKNIADFNRTRNYANLHQTRHVYEWDPTAAIVSEQNDAYDDILPPTPSETHSIKFSKNDLSKVSFNEAASCASHSEAVVDSSQSSALPRPDNLLEGGYDEAASAASFQEAVLEWRASAAARQEEENRKVQSKKPTLAASVAALTLELGLEADMPLVHLVSRANEVVGLKGEGSLVDQVDALVSATGISVGGVGVGVPTVCKSVGEVVETQTVSGVNYLELLRRDERAFRAQRQQRR